MVTRGGMPSGVQLVNAASRMQRKTRSPAHTFYLKAVPFTIQPFMIAPVLPGETLKDLKWQARAVTDPINNSVIGWFFEQYFFYVKLRDLDDRDTITNGLLDPAASWAALKETDDTVSQYFNPSTNSNINWTEKCLKRVTEEYFRAQSETWNNVTIGGLPVASVVGSSWLDSFVNDDAFQTSIEPTIDTSGASVGISTIEAALRNWEMLKAQNMGDITFEDFCEMYGVSLPTAEQSHKPELIRFERHWQYPSNTINTTTGAPTSAVSWAVAERASKPRAFKEPGFIFGVCVFRPKVYFSSQKQPVVNFMDTQFAWLPAQYMNDPNTGLIQFAAGTGPLPGNTDDYWIDIHDLFMRGDQFINVDPTTAGIGSLALPTAAGVWKYPTNQAMLDNLTVSANATVRVDGVVNLSIASRMIDPT